MINKTDFKMFHLPSANYKMGLMPFICNCHICLGKEWQIFLAGKHNKHLLQKELSECIKIQESEWQQQHGRRRRRVAAGGEEGAVAAPGPAHHVAGLGGGSGARERSGSAGREQHWPGN